MENFATVIDDFRAANALVEVAGEAELMEALSSLLHDPGRRRAYGSRAAAVVERKRGATEQTVKRMQEAVGGNRTRGDAWL